LGPRLERTVEAGRRNGSNGDGNGRALSGRLAVAALEGTRSAGSTVVGKGQRFFDEVGGMTAMSMEAFRRTWEIRKWWREWLDQCWFMVKVTALPVFLIALPLGATVSLQIGQFARQLGAQSVTGTAVVLALVREVAPIACALLISGAGGSAMSSDMGSRRVRDELAAMEVMAVNPIYRLVTPRLWAASSVAVLLVSLVVLAGVAGGFLFNVIIQDVTPGAYFSGATSLLVPSDLAVSLFKAWVFGFIAAVIACYKGMNCDLGPAGVGRAVNKSVVQTAIAIFVVNYVITTIYIALVPPVL
jgi:phospholipid/cholesterol/gamma-HCH transport system permease protein